MDNSMKRPEILSPAGDMTCLEAALGAGANAVYLGLENLNMRSRSGVNFSRKTLPDAASRCHAKGVRIYLALNSIVFNSELQELEDTVEFASRHVDAFIVGDWAAIQSCRKRGAEFHISTQMSCANKAAAAFYASIGAKRAVLARECTLSEAAEIVKSSGIEVETFVHGAQCVAESGRCFLSHEAYGESANRGRCRQPCRRRYIIKAVDRWLKPAVPAEGRHTATFEVEPHTLLSAKDLCSLPFIKRLAEAGISSFKIEGRARSAEYVHATVSAYKEAVDAVMAGTYSKEICDRLVERVSNVFHREFNFGLFFGRPGENQFTDFEDSIAPLVKKHIGILRNYYLKAGVAEIAVQDEALTTGETIQIHGPTTGVVEMTVPELRRHDEIIASAKKGEWATFKCPRARIGDKVFKMEKRS